ncbi:MAG TPA: hypothetical protein VIJ41_14455, partial [Candidatus Nanopelagicales bacterium]
EGVMSLARRSGSAEAQMTAAMRHGVALATGDPRGATDAFLEAAAIAERAGIRPAQAMGLANAAESAIDLGELAVATRALAEADEIGGATGLEQDGVALSKALLSAYLGDSATANSALDRLEADRRPDWTAVQMTTWYLRTRSAVRLLDGDLASALADARESITLEASGGNASTSLWQGIQAAARLRDAETIIDLLSATAGLRGEWVDGVRATADQPSPPSPATRSQRLGACARHWATGATATFPSTTRSPPRPRGTCCRPSWCRTTAWPRRAPTCRGWTRTACFGCSDPWR